MTARRELPQHIKDHIRAEVAKAPRLTAEQRATIRMIFAPALEAIAAREADAQRHEVGAA